MDPTQRENGQLKTKRIVIACLIPCFERFRHSIYIYTLFTYPALIFSRQSYRIVLIHTLFGVHVA
jgi:hypothetical protein